MSNDIKKWYSSAFGIALAVLSSSTLAAVTPELRVKLGGAAGIDTWEFPNLANGNATQKGGGNFQIEVAFTSQSASEVNFVGTVGLFGRRHSGHVNDPVLPTDIDYDANGIAGSAGLSFKASPNLHFEGRFELGLGRGEPTLTTPGFVWNSRQAGGYASASLIFGGFYTFSSPGLQLGLELGAQSFAGDFQIQSNNGSWQDGTVKGSGLIGNLTIGYRF